MAHPKRRRSHSRARTARASRKVASPAMRACPRCGQQGRPHTVCESCGHYAGRQVIDKDEF